MKRQVILGLLSLFLLNNAFRWTKIKKIWIIVIILIILLVIGIGIASASLLPYYGKIVGRITISTP